ncbi:hypothetical protein EDC04DRAFT_2605820 [Pisolithus marmoratus]|nr:hypothetical protein EDC04DRAFT_2605820 [Pisolithus marmoratus]
MKEIISYDQKLIAKEIILYDQNLIITSIFSITINFWPHIFHLSPSCEDENQCRDLEVSPPSSIFSTTTDYLPHGFYCQAIHSSCHLPPFLPHNHIKADSGQVTALFTLSINLILFMHCALLPCDVLPCTCENNFQCLGVLLQSASSELRRCCTSIVCNLHHVLTVECPPIMMEFHVKVLVQKCVQLLDALTFGVFGLEVCPQSF